MSCGRQPWIVGETLGRTARVTQWVWIAVLCAVVQACSLFGSTAGPSEMPASASGDQDAETMDMATDGSTASDGRSRMTGPTNSCVTDFSVGYNNTCAVKNGGSVWCWGNSEYGQLGDS